MARNLGCLTGYRAGNKKAAAHAGLPLWFEACSALADLGFQGGQGVVHVLVTAQVLELLVEVLFLAEFAHGAVLVFHRGDFFFHVIEGVHGPACLVEPTDFLQRGSGLSGLLTGSQQGLLALHLVDLGFQGAKLSLELVDGAGLAFTLLVEAFRQILVVLGAAQGLASQVFTATATSSRPRLATRRGPCLSIKNPLRGAPSPNSSRPTLTAALRVVREKPVPCCMGFRNTPGALLAPAASSSTTMVTVTVNHARFTPLADFRAGGGLGISSDYLEGNPD